MNGYGRIVVVGAGRAGVTAATRLRQAGFSGEVTVLCDDPDAPYDRPACSKGVLVGHSRPQDVTLPVPGGQLVTWRLGQRAVRLDTRARRVLTDGGEPYPYDGLVIATGSRPTVPADWPFGAPGVHHLHTLADAWAVRADLRHAERVVVLGGGLTGCEVASAVRELARECVLVDSGPAVMARALGIAVAREVTWQVAREGVDLRLGCRAIGLHRWSGGWVVTLDNGDEILTDVVVATIGERPDTDWLTGSGLDVTDGVRCDESLRVLGAEGVVAAGSVARWPNRWYATDRPIRIGQWIAAMEQGRAAADALLAGEQPVPPVTVVPRFWSDQFGLRIQVCGELPAAATVDLSVLRPRRRDPARAGLVATHHADGQLVGVVAVNAPYRFTSLARSLLATARRVVRTPATGQLAPTIIGGTWNGR